MTVRELVVKVGYKTDTKSIKKAGDLLKNLKKVGLASAAAIAAVAAASWKLVDSVSQTGDEIAKTARDIGMNGEALQRWTHTANLAGIEANSLNTSLNFFGKAIGETATFGIGRAKDSFDVLGISIKNVNGQTKSQNDLLLELADKFQNIEDPAMKAKISTDLFGRSGIRMASLLSQGRTQIEKFNQEADDLGLVMSEEQLTNAEKFRDTLARFQAVLKGIAQELASTLLPIIENVMLVLTELFQGALGTTIKKLIGIIKPVLIMVNDLLLSVIEGLQPAIDILLDVLASVFKVGLGGILGLIKSIMPIISSLIEGIATSLKPIMMVMAILEPVFKLLEMLLTPIADLISLLIDDGNRLFNDLFAELMPIIQDFANIFMEIFEGLGPLLKPILGAFMTLLKVFFKLNAIFNKALIKGLMFPLRVIVGIIRGLVELVGDKLSPAFEKLSGVFEGVKGALAEFGNAMATTIGNAFNTVIGIINGAIATINKFPGINVQKIEPIEVDNFVESMTGSNDTNSNKTTNVNADTTVNVSGMENGEQIKGAIEKSARTAFQVELEKLVVTAGY